MRILCTALTTAVLAALFVFGAGCGKSSTKSEADAEPGAAPSEPAQPEPAEPERRPGSWAYSGDLPFGLDRPSMTLLDDGRVFVFGDSRERRGLLFDPKTETWTPTAPARFARPWHAASKLPDGRVLVTGGVNIDKDFYVLRTTEIFDPKAGPAGAWEQAEHLPSRRRGHTQTILKDGRVMAIGGDPGGFAAPVGRVDLFDPGTGKWTATGELVVGRYLHGASRLSDKDDRVLVVGGENKDGPLESGEICEPTKTRCERLTVIGKRSGPRVVGLNPLSAGVIVTGGLGKRTTSAQAFRYDALNGKVESAGAPAEKRVGHVSVALKDGRAWVAGGKGDVLLAETFDPQTGRWAPAGSAAESRIDGAAIVLENGGVLLAGGAKEDGKHVLGTQIWSPGE